MANGSQTLLYKAQNDTFLDIDIFFGDFVKKRRQKKRSKSIGFSMVFDIFTFFRPIS